MGSKLKALLSPTFWDRKPLFMPWKLCRIELGILKRI